MVILKQRLRLFFLMQAFKIAAKVILLRACPNDELILFQYSNNGKVN